MDDDPWGNNAWSSTTTTTPNKPSALGVTPAWPASSTPVFSETWGASPGWEAATADDSGDGWGSKIQDVSSDLPSSESEAKADPAVEQLTEYPSRSSSPPHGQHSSIPHSPLPSSPPDESQTVDSQSPVVEEPLATPHATDVFPPLVSSPGPLDDSFGGFESAGGVKLGATGLADDPWSPSADDVAFAAAEDLASPEVDPATSADAWGSTWGAMQSPEEPTPSGDEWVVARARKERRDHNISPETASSYLAELESVITLIWPDAPPPRAEPTTEWRAPLEDISELQALRKTYHLPTMTTMLSSPPPMVPPLLPYSTTQIATRQRAAIKATRISAVAQLSPFAHLMSARSIPPSHRLSKASFGTPKSSLDFGEGVVGVGWAWAHNEKKPELAPIAPVSAPSPTPLTPSGRFSGFWTRARGSTERSSSQISRSNTPAITSPSTSSLGETVGNTKPVAVDSTLPPSPQPPEPQPPAPVVEQPISGVSRFFKRFSRANPLESERAKLATSESVSLSTSDLEFLEDFVPDSAPKSLLDGGRGLSEVDALESMLRSTPPPKNVPVLAPPPRAGTPSQSSLRPLTGPANSTTDDELWDIFGAPPVPVNGGPGVPLLPPPAPGRLTPSTTTPVASAPTSRSHTPRLPSIADLAVVVGGKGSHLRQTSFSTHPQQAFRANVPSLDSPSIPSLSPPPGRGPGLAKSDVFADFIGDSPSKTQNHNHNEAPARVSFDDFGDFESFAPSQPVIRSPSPPKPPSKTGTPVFIRTGLNIQRASEPTGALPPLLPPPPSAPSRSGTPAMRSATPIPALPQSRSPPPPTQLQTQVDLFDFGSSPPQDIRVPTPFLGSTNSSRTASAKPSTGGGLSASDLSFFEGL